MAFFMQIHTVNWDEKIPIASILRILWGLLEEGEKKSGGFSLSLQHEAPFDCYTFHPNPRRILLMFSRIFIAMWKRRKVNFKPLRFFMTSECCYVNRVSEKKFLMSIPRSYLLFKYTIFYGFLFFVIKIPTLRDHENILKQKFFEKH